ncbi:TPA: GNAT family N-acetyltransferase [Candidatus Bathyarchaeota archaeon]|nr:GNAT family N-acetyltransferase [Candidatus Bathyarchaeota archaeon]
MVGVTHPILILKATEEDAYELAKVSSEAAKEGMVREFKPEEMKGLISNEGYYIAVGKLGEEVVGYILSTYSWGKLHILDIAVKKSKRRMGIGKALVKHLISHASEKGLPEVYCEVKARNIPALNLFAGLGFRFRLFSTLVEGGFYGLYLSIQAHER